MPDLFTHDDYKKYVRAWILERPNKGRGQVQSIAAHLRVHSSLISHVLHQEHKDLTAEQACSLCEYMGLNSLESDYFLTLVDLRRAGSDTLRRTLRRRLVLLGEQSLLLSVRLAEDRILSDDERSTFYSSWQYSAVRLLCSIPGPKDVGAIAARLHIPVNHCQRVLDFLQAKDLIVLNEGQLQLGPARIHVGSNSKFVGHHHRSWRIKAMASFDALQPTDLVFTAPISLSKQDYAKLRSQIVDFIAAASERVKASPAELIACLNIDLVEL